MESKEIKWGEFLENRKLDPIGQVVLEYRGGDIGAFRYAIKPCCRIILHKPGWPLIKIGDHTFTQDEALNLTNAQIIEYYGK